MTPGQYKGLAKCMIEMGLFDDIFNRKGAAPSSNPPTKNRNSIISQNLSKEQTRSDRDHARPPF